MTASVSFFYELVDVGDNLVYETFTQCKLLLSLKSSIADTWYTIITLLYLLCKVGAKFPTDNVAIVASDTESTCQSTIYFCLKKS